MPDLLGVAFAFMLLALGVGYDFSQPALARLVSLAAFTGMLMLTRRSYMFTVVAFFLLYGVWVLARAARARQVQTALRFGRFAAASLVCVGVPLLPMFWRIAKADYSDRYATYQTGGFLAELANQRVYLGWLVFVIMLIGILYGLYNAKARALAVLAAVGRGADRAARHPCAEHGRPSVAGRRAVLPAGLLPLCAARQRSAVGVAAPHSGNSGGRAVCAELRRVQPAAAGGFPQRILQRTVLLRGQPPQ